MTKPTNASTMFNIKEAIYILCKDYINKITIAEENQEKIDLAISTSNYDEIIMRNNQYDLMLDAANAGQALINLINGSYDVDKITEFSHNYIKSHELEKKLLLDLKPKITLIAEKRKKI